MQQRLSREWSPKAEQQFIPGIQTEREREDNADIEGEHQHRHIMRISCILQFNGCLTRQQFTFKKVTQINTDNIYSKMTLTISAVQSQNERTMYGTVHCSLYKVTFYIKGCNIDMYS